MKQWIHALAALVAGLVFAGCGDVPPAPDDDVSALASTQCTAPGEIEQQYAASEGYDPDGCTRTERMAHVRGVFRFEPEGSYKTLHVTADENGPANEGDIGQLREAVSVGFGIGLRLSVNGQGEATDATDLPCLINPTWTTAQPVLGDCLIPNNPHETSWAVWPGYDLLTLLYMNSRMADAWNSWVHNGSFCGQTNSPGIRDAASAHLLTGATGDVWDHYFLANVPVFPVFDNGQSDYLGRMFPEIHSAVPKTPIRVGNRYWGWKYAGIGVNHNILEGIKMDSCVDPFDPNAELRLQNAYVTVLAHEIGHAWGWPHINSGLMRPGDFMQCGDVYALTPPNARGMPSAFEQYANNATKSTSGFSVTFPIPQGSNCAPMLQDLPTSSHRDVYPLN